MTDEHSTQTLSARDIALLEKYKVERAKRIRADGLAQFRRTDDEFAHFLEDPYVEPLNRAPMEDEPDVVVVGGGWSGMLFKTTQVLTENAADIRYVDILHRPTHTEIFFECELPHADAWLALVGSGNDVASGAPPEIF